MTSTSSGVGKKNTDVQLSKSIFYDIQINGVHECHSGLIKGNNLEHLELFPEHNLQDTSVIKLFTHTGLCNLTLYILFFQAAESH